ncbi:MAG: SPOR domain-containing protein [Saprospiraceae bacterium]|jgi:hypothetical protein
MRKTTRIIYLILAMAFSVSGQAQSWQKMAKTADEFFSKGDYAKAAKEYEKAYAKKDKKELLFKIGESYYLMRNYREAAESYQNIKDLNKEFSLVGLKYARSLKQDGQYDRAIRAFQDFLKGYAGENKATMEDIISDEIQGCELGKSLPLQPMPDVEVSRPGSGINTESNEFAPFCPEVGVLYYSSTMGGQARIYRSEKNAGDWSKGLTPENFPVIQNGQYCNGSLSPDGSRFYFTICENSGAFGNLSTRCEIFVIEKEGFRWSVPKRLPDFVNVKGYTATQPWVVHRGDVEIVYFASNRQGGRGSLDLWYITTNINRPGDFSQPINLGPAINTLGNEMSPYFDPAEGNLYFASNGHVSMGGFDIQKARGDLTNWATPVNVGLPYNSSADDFFFVKGENGSVAFLSSNRISAGEKTTTQDDDIFEIRLKPRTLPLEGYVFDLDLGEPLRSFNVVLSEIQDNGSETPLVNRIITDGAYRLEILPQRQYRVAVNAEGYEGGSYTFFTSDQGNVNYGQPLFLRKLTALPPAPVANPAPVTNPVPPVTTPAPAPTNAGSIGVPGETYTLKGTSQIDNLEYRSNAPRYYGVYYKIQLTAVGRFDPADARYSKLSDLGSIQTEFILSRNLTRVLVGDFMDETSVRQAFSQVKRRGFPGAYIAKYENGVRYGRVNL